MPDLRIAQPWQLQQVPLGGVERHVFDPHAAIQVAAGAADAHTSVVRTEHQFAMAVRGACPPLHSSVEEPGAAFVEGKLHVTP